jgi:hypothetical protein
VSRTDKDLPYRIHVQRRGRESHDHRLGECDLDQWQPERYWIWSHRTRCRIELGWRYSDVLTLYPRTKRVQAYRRMALGSERVDGRRIARAAVTRARAGSALDADELEPRYVSGRHDALWEAW